MSFRFFWGLLVMLVTVFPSQHARAFEGWKLDISAGGWRNLTVPGTRENRFIVRGDALQVVSDRSVSFRYLELPRSTEYPTHLSWAWRVDQHAPVASQALKGFDDRPLAVHVWFDTGKSGSLFGGLTSAMGRPKVGHLLTYVWGAREPPGSVLRNPYFDKGRVIVLVGDNGRTGQWQRVERNVVEDYRRAFGQAPDMTQLRYIAISADTDDLSGQSNAAVRGLAFHMP